MRVCLESGAVRRVAAYLEERSFRRVILAADAHTWEAAGAAVAESARKAGIEVTVTRIRPDRHGDVIADEASVVQLAADIKAAGAECVIAAGSGTIHDISRFSAYVTGIPFLSVPTAPSVDGFNSKGAPLILRGDKVTVAAIGPDAMFADLDVLAQAPTAMVAAGFGDMLGKYTSLFDWKFGSLLRGEPYADEIAQMTRKALQQCVEGVEEIAARTPEGIRLLMDALIQSGEAMLQFGQSHPASGAEHHLSHYWELEFLRFGKRPVLHGAKVGVACGIIADLYRSAVQESKLPAETKALAGDIRRELAELPDGDTIRSLLEKVGGPTRPEQIGVDSELLDRSLREAPRIRPNRHTLLSVLGASL